VTAPRAFNGILGRVADSWMEKGLDRSTLGNLNINFNYQKLDPLNLQPDFFGFHVAAGFSFHDFGYKIGLSSYEISGSKNGGVLTFEHGRLFGCDLSMSGGIHWGNSKKTNINGHNLNIEDFYGDGIGTSIGVGPVE